MNKKHLSSCLEVNILSIIIHCAKQLQIFEVEEVNYLVTIQHFEFVDLLETFVR